MYYLFFDTETGGTNSEVHSLLTAYFAVCNADLQIIDELYLQLKPSDTSKMVVSAEALQVNNINLEEHIKDPNTLTYEEGYRVLFGFLEKNKIKGKRKSFIPCGHNVQFDKDFIWAQLMTQEVWEKNVHYRTLDTSIACNLLKDGDLIPQDLGSLTSLVSYFKIPIKDAHNAKGDILMNIEVYKSIKNMMRSLKKGSIGSTSVNSSLLEIVED